jgi:hypothetical protein
MMYPRSVSTDLDEQDYIPAVPRQQGRAVPEQKEPSFDIKLDGEVIGTVFPMRLTGGAQIDLEEAKTTRQLITWLVEYAGNHQDSESKKQHAMRVEAKLRALGLAEIRSFAQALIDALVKSVELGNESGPR